MNGADRARTDNPLLAKQVLSQLSYRPVGMRIIVWIGRQVNQREGDCTISSLIGADS